MMSYCNVEQISGKIFKFSYFFRTDFFLLSAAIHFTSSLGQVQAVTDLLAVHQHISTASSASKMCMTTHKNSKAFTYTQRERDRATAQYRNEYEFK